MEVDKHVTHRVHLFRSYYNCTPPSSNDSKLLRLNLNDQRTAKVWKVSRATSATPGLFDPIRIHGLKYIDGGIIDNNPIKYAWVEVSSTHQNHPAGRCPSEAEFSGIRFLVSIGAGKRPKQSTRGDFERMPF
jgi:hypothetical protein